ncbi:hypothetical protein [Microtetraspora sp. NBRC 16547]|uniref:hypothetical protein n=1 Tax=Microtetraspora sp. NBRC 16547 TaxID=3030993 RepID=UPI0024A3699A|nr:hypothetical protein [Microtetraspora sp. NBRC 16547]GLX00701.1 hypothetical protein Misp02_47870 [Microtetraspora sp. NBRC 16547]
MAVPPIPQARTAVAVRAVRVPLLLDVVLGLLVAVALPLAIVAIPNTISVVAALLPPDASQVAMVRAHGLALPVMLLAVPLAAVAVRRFRAAPILVVGLTLLAAADAAGGYAGSTFVVGVLRVLHGIGAGLLLPATLVAAWERPRRRFLLPVWAGMLAASLAGAQALALWPLAKATSWQVTLQPYPLLTGVALALAAVYLVLWIVAGDGADGSDAERPSAAELRGDRGRLTRAAVLAAGIAALAVGMTFDWPAVLAIAAAAVAVIAVLGLCVVTRFEEPGGRTLAFASVAVGLVVLPTAAQATYLEMGGVRGGPGLSGLWLPLTLAAVVTVASAYAASTVGDKTAAKLVGGGLVAIVAALCAIRLLIPTSVGLVLVVPFSLLAGGAAVALVAALRTVRVGTALFGLSLCFPALLGGFLLGTGVQRLRIDGIRSSAAAQPTLVADAFLDALWMWALVGGFIVVGIIVMASWLGRREPGAARQNAQVLIPSPTPSPEEMGAGSGETSSDR